MVTSREPRGSATVRRQVRGGLSRLRDAGHLIRTGSVPQGRLSRLRPPDVGPAEAAPPMYFGWTRYSAYLQNRSAFKAAQGCPDPQAYKRLLWSQDRMRTRSRLFLDLSVPQLQQMRGHHAYRHLVSYSADMPDPWQAQLHAAADRYDVLLLHPVDADLLHDAMQKHLVHMGSPSRTVVWFRVDDDDLLGLSYLDELGQYATVHDRGRAVSLSGGYSALWDGQHVSHLRRTRRRLGSQGQAYVGWWDAATQQLDLPRPGNHATVDERMPTILDARCGVFLQLRHVGQDTATRDAGFDALRAKHTSGPAVPDVERVLVDFPTLRPVYDET